MKVTLSFNDLAKLAETVSVHFDVFGIGEWRKERSDLPSVFSHTWHTTYEDDVYSIELSTSGINLRMVSNVQNNSVFQNWVSKDCAFGICFCDTFVNAIEASKPFSALARSEFERRNLPVIMALEGIVQKLVERGNGRVALADGFLAGWLAADEELKQEGTGGIASSRAFFDTVESTL